MVRVEWVLLEVVGDTVVSIAEVWWEVVVAEQVAHHRYPMGPHLRMVCSHLGTFLVVHALWYRRRQ